MSSLRRRRLINIIITFTLQLCNSFSVSTGSHKLSSAPATVNGFSKT